jgi:hypothetical protein
MDEKMLKNYWFWVVVIVLAGVAFFYLKLPVVPRPTVSSTKPSPSSIVTSGKARLVIYFGDGTARTFEGNVSQDMTILQSLDSASMGAGFDLKYSIAKNGSVNLESIDGAVNMAPKKWSFYLNQKAVPSTDLNMVKIQNGDLIEAKYE